MNQNEDVEPRRPSRRHRVLIGSVVAVIGLGSLTAVAGALRDDSGVLTDAERAQILADLDRQLAGASAEQQSVAADGEIEAAEMTALAEAASACSVDQGAPAMELRWNGNRLDRTQHFDPELPSREFDRLLAVSDKCWDEHLGVVEMMKAADVVPSVDKQVAYNHAVTACLNKRGEPGANWPVTMEDIDPAVEASCVEEVESASD